MLVVESANAKAAKKMSIVMLIIFVITFQFGALFTMHLYVRPSQPSPRGLRVFGFSRANYGASTPNFVTAVRVGALIILCGLAYVFHQHLGYSRSVRDLNKRTDKKLDQCKI